MGAPPPMRTPERPFIERKIAITSQWPPSNRPTDWCTSWPMLLPPPRMSTPTLVRMPSAVATWSFVQESPAAV